MATTLILEGVRCAGCVGKIERGLAETPGVSQARVNFPQRRLRVEGDISEADLIHAVEDIGFGAKVDQNSPEYRAQLQQQEENTYRLRLRSAALALALGLPTDADWLADRQHEYHNGAGSDDLGGSRHADTGCTGVSRPALLYRWLECP